MHLLLLVILMLASTMTNACPDLAGSFICGYKDDGEPNNLSIQQNGNKFLLLLPGSAENIEITADGKSYQMETEDYIFDFANSCSATDMSIRFDSFNKKEAIKSEGSTAFKRFNDRQIKYYFSRIITTKDATYEQKMTRLCTKI